LKGQDIEGTLKGQEAVKKLPLVPIQ
jgi:hypothetical protein